MNSIKILWISFIFSCIISELYGQCTTAYGGQGQCKLLDSCAPLAALAYKMPRNPQDTDVLRRSHCGYFGNTPAVCCPQNQPRPTLAPAAPTPPRPRQTPPPPPPPRPPIPPSNNQCVTPDRKLGQCISLYSCPHIVKLLDPPASKENIQYVTNARCQGSDQYSICCPASPPDPAPTEPNVRPTVTRPNFTGPNRGPPVNSKCPASVSAYPPDPESGCCGEDISFGDKIIGGSEAAIDQFPWMVLIEYEQGQQVKLSCGGALISGRYVLTAAHCLTVKDRTPKRIRLGEYDTTMDGPDCVDEDCTPGVTKIPIEEVIVHPNYNPLTDPARKHDIGLIRMNRLAPFNEFIRPICLPKLDITLDGRTIYNFTVAGWGAVTEKMPKSPIKLFVDLPYVSRNRCQPSYDRRIRLGEGQFCAGGVVGKDSCKGDSGGPLMLENYRRADVVGIVSFGPVACGANNVPGVYTNVYHYLSWINSNIHA